jgi:hypothetical protein
VVNGFFSTGNPCGWSETMTEASTNFPSGSFLSHTVDPGKILSSAEGDTESYVSPSGWALAGESP